MMMNFLKNHSSVIFIFSFLISPFITFCQPKPLTCADVKNGVFIFFPKNETGKATYTRNGDMQQESNAETHETLLWDVQWINDCSYYLKYNSGAEGKPKAEMDILKKHKIAIEILNVTEDYYVFKSSLDKISNATIMTDTLWIKQRRGLSNKLINNPGIDSITALKKAISDSAKTKYATLYVFRPAKTLNMLMNYDLLINDAPACEVMNNSTYIIKLLKEGPAKLYAKIRGQESSANIDVKFGNKYFLKCEITWGLKSSPILTVVKEEEARPYFGKIK